MAIEIVEESVTVLPDYGNVSSAFLVEAQLRVEPIRNGLGGLRLIEERVELPYVIDFDRAKGEGPKRWLKRWDISHWGALSAFDGPRRVGGAVVAWRTPGVDMLEGRGQLLPVTTGSLPLASAAAPPEGGFGVNGGDDRPVDRHGPPRADIPLWARFLAAFRSAFSW